MLYSIEYLESFLKYTKLISTISNFITVISIFVIIVWIILLMNKKYKKDEKKVKQLNFVFKVIIIFVLISIHIWIFKWYKQFQICWKNENCVSDIQKIIDQSKLNEKILMWIQEWIFEKIELNNIVDINDLIKNLKQ